MEPRSLARRSSIALFACLLSACGGGGGGGGQTSYIIDPTTCDGLTRTSITLYLTEKTNYCTFLKSDKSNWCPPVEAEKVLMLGIGDTGVSVDPIATGTYTMSDRLVVYGLVGDGTLYCPAVMATSGTVTLTSIGKGGVEGTYDVTIDGVNYAGTIDAPLCWQGTVSCT